MKIRVGYGLGTTSQSGTGERFSDFVDNLERLAFDSLWLSERLTSECPDPLMAMAFACGRTTKLKVGMSVLVLPGRNPVILAKSLASLDQLSGGRVLPAFGLGAADSAEHQAFGVDPKDRGGWFNEALPLMRRLWTEDHVTHQGKRFTISDVTVAPKPLQKPFEVWLGGASPLELRRVGRHGDGWLPSFCLPKHAEAGRSEIERIARENDREIDPEHFGALVPYRSTADFGSSKAERRYQAILERRAPGAQLDDVVPFIDHLPTVLQRFIDVGFSKFVLVPVNEPTKWGPELERVKGLVGPLET